MWNCNIPHHWLHVTSHHFTSNRSTTSPHTIPHHAHIPPHTTPCRLPHSNINCTSRYPTAHIPNHTTRITPPCQSNMASNHSISVFHNHFSTSCITAHHYHITHVPHRHSTSHHHISQHLAWPCRHRTLFHTTATLGWIRHNIPHLALQNVPHHTAKFHTTLFYITPCDVVNTNIEMCGMMWDVVWCGNADRWDVQCITHCIIPHQTPSDIPNHITFPRHTITPHPIAPTPLAAHYFTLQYNISNRTVSATLCITPHLAPHFVITFRATFHIHHATFQITPYNYWPHYASHHILHNGGTAFHMLHILHNCILPPHLIVITSHYHVLHSIPHHTSVPRHILSTSLHLPHLARHHLHYDASRRIGRTAQDGGHLDSHTAPRWTMSVQKPSFRWCLMSSDVGWHIRDKLRPVREHGLIYVHGGSLGRTAQDGHLDSHTAPELCTKTGSVVLLNVLVCRVTY